jgi:putative OPT family oligopeptide transporter
MPGDQTTTSPDRLHAGLIDEQALDVELAPDSVIEDKAAELAKGEFTVLSIVLMTVLGVILSGANTYLGLFSGFPISVAIPSSIMSMGVHRLFGRNNMLANNIVQTGASSGALVAGASLIIIPSFLIMNFWETVHYWQTTTVACIGSLLGIVFSIPLRRILIIEKKLKFPEGIATAEVLKIAQYTNDGLGPLYIILAGALLGTLFKFLETGLCLWNPVMSWATYISTGSSIIFFVSTFSSPALISVGYIVGVQVSAIVFLGAGIGFWFFLPLVADFYKIRQLHPNDATQSAQFIFEKYYGTGVFLCNSESSSKYLQGS